MLRTASALLLAASAGAMDPGVGEYVANLITINFPKASVQSMIDDGLVLGSVPGQPAGDEGKHPVIFCFGQQREVHPSIHIGNLPFNWAYSEFIMSVPFVYLNTTGQNQGPFTFQPRLFLDNITKESDASEAILAGWAYALAKRAARIVTEPTIPWGLGNHQYHISERKDSSKKLLTLSATTTTGWQEPSSFPKFQVIGAAMDNTLIGDTSMFGKDATGKFRCTKFNWHLERARIASLTGQLSIADSYIHGLPVGLHNFTGVETTDFGAFRLATNWSISMPALSC
eukprot:TRINITY_DN46936_c0_g1_i1.p1 TRINITY_DN46936_c0_g1~~TRINITY_DN46936_c0_g1_i1.p1  ORF type:complete len:302 (+),score=110.95 TRINITY_DN46936_c0_g1_i1:53-907(+)